MADDSEFESRRSNACAILNDEEFRRIVEAAELYVASRSVLMSFIATLGNVVNRGLNRIPEDWREDVTRKIRETLDFAQRVSIVQMDDEPGRRSSEEWYTAMAVASGVAGGALGLASVLAELPVTTGLILRSIADIGRAHGERLNDAGFRATCIEVFAYGGPLDEDDDADITFVASRIGAVEVSELVAKVAARYAAAIAPKIAVMSVPIAGGVLGAGVNWAYMNFYQAMARVLFMLRPIERTHDATQVRSCFGSVVRELAQRTAARRTGGRSA